MAAMSEDGDIESQKTGVMEVPRTLTKDHRAPVTFAEGSKKRRASMTRTLSVSMATGPQRPLVQDKVPAEFRTLSLHVTLTREGDRDGATIAKGKRAVKELADLDWQTLTIDYTLARLGVSPQRGLEPEQATRRLSSDGPNVITPPPTNWPKKIANYVFGGFNTFLLVAAVLCFVAWKPLGEPNPQTPNLALAVVLLVVVLVNGGFNAWQDFSTSRIMQSISGMLPSEVEVLRDGTKQSVPSKAIVSGDIVTIKMGNKVPCDCRIIECSADASFDRSILTGESEAVIGSSMPSTDSFLESHNIVLQGTLCVAGSATAVAIQTGDRTVFGRISNLASRQTATRTTLEREVFLFVMVITAFAAATCVLVLILWAAWLRRSYPGFINVPTLLIDLVSVAVAFIPEGLPICVTLSLSIIANRMKNADVLCKTLSTVETLGCIDVMLSDKTGTLTTNQMTVVETYAGAVRRSTADLAAKIQGFPVGRALASIAAICNDARYEASQISQGDRPVVGDATDSGLLRFSDAVTDGASETTRADWAEKYRLAFNSKNKFAVKLLQSQSSKITSPILSSDEFSESDYLLLVKGAPDVLLKRCTTILSDSGENLPLNEETMQALVSAQTEMASGGQRVLLLARRIIPSQDLSKEAFNDAALLADTVMKLNLSLQVVGLVGLLDPPRHDTRHTVETCRRAGIRFMVVTGDFAMTAVAIARTIGVITNEHVDSFADLIKDQPLDQIAPYAPKEEGAKMKSLALSGTDLLTMTDATWKQTIAYDEIVFARTTPEQKLKIVKAFQAAGHCCSATGDGTNDAAAIKEAKIGIAFANGSTVAVEAADLVLLGNLSSIIEGIRLGRLVFENLKKTILYLLPAGSFSELWPVLVSIFFGLPQPLSSIQMIIICCITDLLAGLSMVREAPESDLLLKRPRNIKTDRLADWKLLLQAYGFLGMIETLTSMAMAFHFGFVRQGIPFSTIWLNYGQISSEAIIEATYRTQSIYFYNLVLIQFGNLLATRTRRLSIFQQNPFFGETRNLFIIPAVCWSLGAATLFSYIPGIQRAFGTRGIPVESWFIPLAFGLAILILDETRKLCVRTWPKGFLAKIAW